MGQKRKNVSSKSARPRKPESTFKQEGESEGISPLDSTQLQLFIMQKLQTSLNVQELLSLFLESLQERTALQHISFSPAFAHTSSLKTAPSTLHHQLKLFTGEEYIGTLHCQFKTPPDAETQSLIEDSAKLIAFPIQHAIQYQEALKCSEHDTLTTLKNRNAMDVAIDKACDASRRYKINVSILMLDLDHFKKINDTYGHLTGDQILQKLAHLIQQSCRLADQAFRFGGEEFLMLLQNTDASGAVETAERLRKAIEMNDFGGLIEEKDLPLTVSIGIAQYNFEESSQNFIHKADQALYKAKRSGRNQSCLYEV